jgi:hypothetical protein
MLIDDSALVSRAGFWAYCVTTVPQSRWLRLGIQQFRSFGEVFLIDDIIAVKHRSCFPAPNLHDRFFREHPNGANSDTQFARDRVSRGRHSAGCYSRTHAFPLFSRHGQIADSARHPAKPNIAAHSVPSFPEIANDLSPFTCKHTVIRTLPLDAHRDDRVDFPCQLDDTGIFVFRRTRI